MRFYDKMEPKNNSVIQRIDKLIEVGLPPGVKKFLNSLKSWEQNRGLSIKQELALQKIENRHYNKLANNTKNTNWGKQFTQEMKERATICAMYYEANPPYFSDLVYQILNVDEFTPTEKQYAAITTNKYSKKVLKSYFKEPDYPQDSFVMLRKTAPMELLVELGNTPCLVVNTNIKPITTACIGSKKYQILPFNKSKTYLIEERYLKKANIKA
tara:strand:- start:287 stop:925 length:639 start_codon:yes stop_codon:yes gene_type:complete